MKFFLQHLPIILQKAFQNLQHVQNVWQKVLQKLRHVWAKVGEVPTFRASDTDTDLPVVSTDLFGGFLYLKNRFIAS